MFFFIFSKLFLSFFSPIQIRTDALFRLTHNVGSLGVATQALLLLHQLMSSRNSVSDRFYRALYAVLASPELTRSTKAPMFLALLFKSLKQDVSPKRVAAFAKRLLQVASEAPANFACGCLMLTSELLKARPGLWNAVLQGEEKESDAVEKFRDVEDDDDNDEGGKSGKGKKSKSTKEDDDSEDFEVVPLTTTTTTTTTTTKASKAATTTTPGSGSNGGDTAWPLRGSYDMRKREPQYANAERSCFWELLPLASHAHPSVAAMARTLLAGANVSYDGDPLQDLTLHAFLDKFIQKKAKIAARGDSLMQPLRAGSSGAAIGASGGGIVPLGGAAGAAAVGAAFSALDSRDVAPDDAFFYKFYSLQAANGGKPVKKKKKSKGDADDDELVSDEDGSDNDDAMDDFLAGEEDGGDEGIGADPDSVFKDDYDYSQLEAAMKEESDVSGDEESQDEEEEGDGGDFSGEDEFEEEEGMSDISFSEEEEKEEEKEMKRSSKRGGKKTATAAAAAADDELNDEEDSDEVESLDGAEFSDLSSGSGGSEEEEEESDFEEEEESDEASDSDDDADADAEVAALMEKLKKGSKNKKRKKTSDEEDEVPDDINPFELAEATDSEAEEEQDEQQDDGGSGDSGGSSDEEESDDDDDEDLMLDDDIGSESDINSDDDEDTLPRGGRGGGKNKNKKDKPVFASADEYDDLIVRDLDGNVDEKEAEKVKADAGYRSKATTTGGGRGGGRGRGGRGGRGGANKRQKK